MRRVDMSVSLQLRRPGLRESMRREVANPNRVVPRSQAWRDRRVSGPTLRTRGALRYARDQIAEWNGRVPPGSKDRLRLSSGAQRLYVDLCNIALQSGTRGVIDLTYGQLQRARGVPRVQAVIDPGGEPALDDTGDPVWVNDPDWGEGIRTLQRDLRELQQAGFIEVGYVVNRACGGHRLCVNIGGPVWFLDEIQRIEGLARSKGGRVSRPQQRRRPSGGDGGGSYPNPALHVAETPDCDRCGGVGWVDVEGGRVERCDHRDARGRAGP